MPYKDAAKQREYTKQWLAVRRAEWFAGKVCASCGSTENLELDYIQTRTKISHNIWSWSAERREAELAKCQALCHECHLQKSRVENSLANRGIGNRSKLTEQDIKAIRTSTLSRKILGEMYGVHPHHIGKIKRYQRWTHIE